ncbi:hypothetical protein JCGZ_11909 [Jatropha curcas]|uniref:Uncharacterized protein n=1 Tax=Jatropha curcas TaxID=180498 RepID=A0A067KR61_JATCU|nr:hypothetical protein JCGZ_11909 [Jatropha curcas]
MGRHVFLMKGQQLRLLENTTCACEVKGRACDFCFKCLCLSRVLLALAQMDVALAHMDDTLATCILVPAKSPGM